MLQRRLRISILGLIISGLFISPFSGCKQEFFLRFHSEQPVSSKACAKCHIDIYEEWEPSSHAAAWVSEAFLYSLSETGTVVCWGCHAPRAYLPSHKGRPVLRGSNLIEGVNCTACHTIGCSHITVIDADIPEDEEDDRDTIESSTQPCSACHEGTYSQWLEYFKKKEGITDLKTCVECHMPEVQRALMPASQAPSEFSLKKRFYPSPTFKAPSRSALSLKTSKIIETSSGGIDVELMLCNHGAGHHIPSGRYGYREVRLEVQLDGKDSTPVQTKRFFIEMGNALTPGWNGPYRFHFDHRGELLNARVTRVDRKGEEQAILGLLSFRLEDKRTAP